MLWLHNEGQQKRTKMRSSCTLLEKIKVHQLLTVLEYQDWDVTLQRGENLYCWFGTGLYILVCTLLWTTERLQIISPLSRKVVENSCLKIFQSSAPLFTQGGSLYKQIVYLNVAVTHWPPMSVAFQSLQASSLTGIQDSISFTIDCSEGMLAIWRNKPTKSSRHGK